MVNYEIFFGALSSFLVVGIGAFLWILSEFRAMRREFQEENRRTREENLRENERTREENREENRRTREELREEIRRTREELREEIRANTQRILETLYFHRHDPDTGEVIFYPSAPLTPAPPAD